MADRDPDALHDAMMEGDRPEEVPVKMNGPKRARARRQQRRWERDWDKPELVRERQERYQALAEAERLALAAYVQQQVDELTP